MSDDLDFSKMLQDSADSAETFMLKAVHAIDALFGEGYARQNPGLISAFITSAAIEDAGLMVANSILAAAKVIERKGDLITDAIDDVRKKST